MSAVRKKPFCKRILIFIKITEKETLLSRPQASTLKSLACI
jgi:hypothetical protein